MSQKTRIIFAILFSAAILLAARSDAQTVVAGEDFDGGDVNLTSGYDANSQNITLTKFPFSRYGVFMLDEFSGANQAPFALTDDSVEDNSSGGDNPPFPADLEGLFGQARADDDAFFCTVAAGDFSLDLNDLIANWTFDVSSAEGADLTLSIDMGQMSNDAFDGVPSTNFILFEYRFDGNGPFLPAMTLEPIELVGSGFTYRAFDVGSMADIDFDMSGTHLGFAVSSPDVTKTFADTGTTAPNTILDKTPASGPGAGMLDNYSFDLAGSGNSLEIQMSADFDFEAFAFDNIQILTGGMPFVLGDVNCDGVADLLDVAPFVALVTSGEFLDKADANMDGVVDLLDVAPFVAILTGG